MASPKVKVPRVKLGSQGLEVSAQGLGCMGMTAVYGTEMKSQEEITALIHHAVGQGVTFFDTADMYGPHENEIIVGKALKGIRDKVQIATKFANYRDGQFWNVRGDPEYVHSSCEASLKRLDVDCIDLYYQHRVDDKVPIEITVGAMKELVDAGKVKYLGLSEASAADIRRAHAVHPISAVQYEYSLWTRDIERDIIPTCRELGIGIVTYSPLGRGFLAGYKMGTTEGYDFRVVHPRFQGENLAKNEELRARVEAIAQAKKCPLNQLALAWVHHKGADMVPIPGTTKIANLDANIGALGVTLSTQEMEELEAAVPAHEVAGDRYMEGVMERTFQFIVSPPLESWKPTSKSS